MHPSTVDSAHSLDSSEIDEVVYLPEMATLDDIKADIREIKTTLSWHWKTTVLIGGGVLFLFGWIFVKLPTSANTLATRFNSVVRQLANVSANIQLSQPDIGVKLPELMRTTLRNPDHEVGVAEMQALAQIAAEKRIRSDVKQVRAISKALFDSNDVPISARWGAVLSLANYTSELTESPVPLTAKPIPSPSVPFVTGEIAPEMRLTGWGFATSPETGTFIAPIKQFAQNLEKYKQIVARNPGPILDWMQLDANGAGYPIDDLHIRKAVFKNTNILYRGHPLILEDVYFLDCTFLIVPNSGGKEFVAGLLDKPDVSAQIARMLMESTIPKAPMLLLQSQEPPSILRSTTI